MTSSFSSAASKNLTDSAQGKQKMEASFISEAGKELSFRHKNCQLISVNELSPPNLIGTISVCV